MASPSDDLLRKHGLRKTLGRVQVLDYIIACKTAISHSDLSQAFEGTMDRASLYRTLQDFEQHGLIHKVPDDQVSVKYASCKGSCSAEVHHDAHLHFKCDDCEKTYCLEGNSVPALKLPEGFVAHHAEVLIHGLCQHCA